MNQLILGDNLEIMRGMDSESVDLVYLDPPFFSNRHYEVIWGDKGEVRSFEDRWAGGMDHYIGWLKERVEQMHRLLKPTGSIFLHCDWHADAYIRVDILDRIFGSRQLINHITWQRASTHNDTKQGAKHYGRITDTIFFYTKDAEKYTFNPQHERYTSEYESMAYNKKEADGRRFKASHMSAAKGGGDTSFAWKDVYPPKGRFWAYSKANFSLFEQRNLIYYSNQGKPYLKQYLDEMPGTSVDCLWYNCVFKNKLERIGYPTQKPEALLERIIRCASNEGDLVFDPFMGGGTTIAVADRLKRRFIGIDQSVQAVKVTELRLGNQRNIYQNPFSVQLHKYDYDTLRNGDAFSFEHFAIVQFGGQVNTKQRSDSGIDGKAKDGTPIQVKRSDDIGRNVVDNFHSAVMRFDKALYAKNKTEKKEVGYIIAFSFGKGAVEEVARLKNKEEVIIRLVRLDEFVAMAKKPALSLTCTDMGKDDKGLFLLQFTATASSDGHIEFFSWDFNYDPAIGFSPTVFLDKGGRQNQSFKTGHYTVAVQVVDDQGLESIDTMAVKINGVAVVTP